MTEALQMHVHVGKCPEGCVEMRFGVTMVHLPIEAFKEFLSLATRVLQEPECEDQPDTIPDIKPANSIH